MTLRSSLRLVVVAFFLTGCETSEWRSPEAPEARLSEPTPVGPVFELPVEHLSRIHFSPGRPNAIGLSFSLPVDHERLPTSSSGLLVPLGSPWMHGLDASGAEVLEKESRLGPLRVDMSPEPWFENQDTRFACASVSARAGRFAEPTGQQVLVEEKPTGEMLRLLMTLEGSCLSVESLTMRTDEEVDIVERALGREIGEALRFCRALEVDTRCGATEQGIGRLTYTGTGEPLHPLVEGRVELEAPPRSSTMGIGMRVWEIVSFRPSLASEGQSLWYRTGSSFQPQRRNQLRIEGRSTGPALSSPRVIWTSRDHSLVCEVPMRVASEGDCSHSRHVHFEQLAAVPSQTEQPRAPRSRRCALSATCQANPTCTVGSFDGECVQYDRCAAREKKCSFGAPGGSSSEDCAALFACANDRDCRALSVDQECIMVHREAFVELLEAGTVRRVASR